ncbi:hypothetical protein AM274_30470 [Pseudomonas nunensis]|nr:hypothetical protein AM274_30470 [Pseudomonas nunensis]
MVCTCRIFIPYRPYTPFCIHQRAVVVNSEVLTAQRAFAITAFVLEHPKKSLSDTGLIPEARIEVRAPAQARLIWQIEVGT